MVAARLPFGW
ncbi:hypothetical protein AJ53_02507, partial [Mycobacterium tuberculosis MD15212]